MHIDEFKTRLAMVMKAMSYLAELGDASSVTRMMIGLAQGKSIPLTDVQIDEVSGAGQVFPKVTPIHFDKVDDYIKDHVKVRRVLKGDVPGTSNMHCNHNKIVCVDDQLMYIGSDNMYPSYNEEHGIWIDDKDAIGAWKQKFWKGLWDNSKESEI